MEGVLPVHVGCGMRARARAHMDVYRIGFQYTLPKRKRRCKLLGVG
jgi:hypothetical protein